jgi:anti-sigma B factor antagonist
MKVEDTEMPRPSVKVSYRDEAVVALLLDEEILEEPDINRFSDALMAEAKTHAPAKMILNFARVKRLSSASLGALIRLHTSIRSSGGKMVFCRLTPALYQLFKITKLDKIFTNYADEEAALKGLKK